MLFSLMTKWSRQTNIKYQCLNKPNLISLGLCSQHSTDSRNGIFGDRKGMKGEKKEERKRDGRNWKDEKGG